MTNGIDVSHHQNVIDWRKVNTDFAIIKCSQGTGYLDPMYARNKMSAREAGILCGFYHFAGNYNPSTKTSIPADPIKEADWFLQNVGDIREGEIVVLDWEVNHADPVGWCYTFLKRVEEKIGFKPFMYTYEARIKASKWDKVAAAGYPLWAAKYGDNDQIPEPNEKPVTGAWPFYVIWQFSSTGQKAGVSTRVDLNVSDLDLSAIKRYGKPAAQPDPIMSPVIVQPGKVVSQWQKYPEWRDVKIGQSRVTVGSDGCLITDLSDALYWIGKYYTPGQLARLLRFTEEGKLFWESITEKTDAKFVYRYWNFNKDTQAIIDRAINHPTMCVFLEVTLSSGLKHWVWALSSRIPRYRVGDPLYGDFGNTWLRYGGRVTGAAIIDKK